MRKLATAAAMTAALLVSWQSQAAPVCGAIGVAVRPMTGAFADSLGMTEIYGAIFRRPGPGSPAAQAGIEAGDVVTAINGAPLRSWRDFTPAIAAFAPGTRITLNIWRSRQFMIVQVRLGAGRCSPAKASQPRDKS